MLPSIECLTPPGGILFDLLSGHTDEITALTLTSDGMRALTSSLDDTIKLWDLRTGRVVKTLQGMELLHLARHAKDHAIFKRVVKTLQGMELLHVARHAKEHAIFARVVTTLQGMELLHIARHAKEHAIFARVVKTLQGRELLDIARHAKEHAIFARVVKTLQGRELLHIARLFVCLMVNVPATC